MMLRKSLNSRPIHQWRRKQYNSGGAQNAGAKRRPKKIDVPLHFSVVPLQVRRHYKK